MGCTVAPVCLQLVADLSIAGHRQTFCGYCRAGDIAAQSFQLGTLIGFSGNPGPIRVRFRPWPPFKSLTYDQIQMVTAQVGVPQYHFHPRPTSQCVCQSPFHTTRVITGCIPHQWQCPGFHTETRLDHAIQLDSLRRPVGFLKDRSL